jgi:hypothetical protein
MRSIGAKFGLIPSDRAGLDVAAVSDTSKPKTDPERTLSSPDKALVRSVLSRRPLPDESQRAAIHSEQAPVRFARPQRVADTAILQPPSHLSMVSLTIYRLAELPVWSALPPIAEPRFRAAGTRDGC